MNKKLKVLFLTLAVILLSFVIHTILQTYALFYSETEGRVTEKLGNWTIKVNNKDVSSGVIEQFNVEQLQLQSDENVKEGKIAPGLEGSFSITIDPTNTDVSIRYDILLDTSLLKAENIKLAKVGKTDKESELVKTGENTYTGIISLSDIKQGNKDKIEFILKWEDIDEYNEQDTELGKVKGNKISMPITVTITQYLGEEIIPI